nr:hypothetical protein BaRGS_005238 [Batillaria attramentaria]
MLVGNWKLTNFNAGTELFSLLASPGWFSFCILGRCLCCLMPLRHPDILALYRLAFLWCRYSHVFFWCPNGQMFFSKSALLRRLSGFVVSLGLKPSFLVYRKLGGFVFGRRLGGLVFSGRLS